MQVTLRSTTKVVELVINGIAVPARIWEGETQAGVPCHAYITRIAAGVGAEQAEFMRDLQRHQPPTPDIAAISTRMIL